jgi:hypothetical protein
MDDEISKQEMLDFFDANMPEGKKYDRGLAEKIFTIFDSDKSGKISIDEFIKTFIYMEEELKSHKALMKSKYQNEKVKLELLRQELNSYRNEKFNENGLSDFSNIKCELLNVEFPSNSINFNSIKIRITLGDEIQSTKSVAPDTNNQLMFWGEAMNL